MAVYRAGYRACLCLSLLLSNLNCPSYHFLEKLQPGGLGWWKRIREGGGVGVKEARSPSVENWTLGEGKGTEKAWWICI